MTNIIGNKVVLRAVEPTDVEYLYQWENQIDAWGVSGTTQPFSHHTLSAFIESQRYDIFASRQLRLMILPSQEGEPVGAIDLFEFDPANRRVGVGIIIAPQHRRQGYAADALKAIEQYARDYLHVHQIWCGVQADNTPSLELFRAAGYRPAGVKRDWCVTSEGFCDEITLQLILE